MLRCANENCESLANCSQYQRKWAREQQHKSDSNYVTGELYCLCMQEFVRLACIECTSTNIFFFSRWHLTSFHIVIDFYAGINRCTMCVCNFFVRQHYVGQVHCEILFRDLVCGFGWRWALQSVLAVGALAHSGHFDLAERKLYVSGWNAVSL